MKTFEFTGSGTEYFKIWIVNTLLTILTFGIYYPWARVRNNKYLYGNSTIEEKNFDYHATGKQLLIGYLIAAVFFIIYSILEKVLPIGSLILLGIFFIIIPWLIWKSMKFNLHVTSFNNIRFKFSGNLKESYIIFLLIPIISLVAIGFSIYLSTIFKENMILLIFSLLLTNLLYIIAFAYFSVVKTRYLLEYTSYGDAKFNTNIDTSAFIKIILKTFAIGLLVLLISFIIVATITYAFFDINYLETYAEMYKTDSSAALTILLSILYPLIISIYLLLILIWVISFAYYITRIRKYIFENTDLENEVNFISNMKFLPYALILISNFLMIIFTLGLAYPWAKVRVLRYTLNNTSLELKEGFDGYINSKQTKKSGFADQVSDTLDIDIGMPL